jgi:hypothetical protein
MLKMSEVSTDSREKLQVEFSEIVLSEGREPLTSGPCRLVVPISWKRLQEPALSGCLTFLEVYIAKIFEVTIRDSTLPSGECVGGVGISTGLNWSIFAGDSEGSKDGQKWIGNYNIPRKLACEKADEYGLAALESTSLNQFGVGTTQVDIPVLNIFGDEKIDKWKQFVKSFIASFALEVNTEGIMSSVGKALQDPFEGISERGDFQEALADAIQNAKNQLKTTLVAWKLNGISGENGGFTQVNRLSVVIDASSSLEEKSEALFRFTDGEADFVFKLVESEKIAHARRILGGQEKTRVHVRGTLVKEAVDYNPKWSFHLQPESIDFFEIAIEVCDASINFVEQNLSEIGNSTLPNYYWCPWSSKLVEELR